MAAPNPNLPGIYVSDDQSAAATGVDNATTAAVIGSSARIASTTTSAGDDDARSSALQPTAAAAASSLSSSSTPAEQRPTAPSFGKDTFDITIISSQKHISTYRILPPDAHLNKVFAEYAREHSLPLERLLFRYNVTDLEPDEDVKPRDLILKHEGVVIYAGIRELLPLQERERRSFEMMDTQELGW